jgi:hypothetical protein
MTAPKVVRHRPRSFRDVQNARCGAKRDLHNMIILANKGITCPKCIALQAVYKAKAKAELEALESKTRKGPLRKPIAEPAKKRYFLP